MPKMSWRAAGGNERGIALDKRLDCVFRAIARPGRRLLTRHGAEKRLTVIGPSAGLPVRSQAVSQQLELLEEATWHCCECGALAVGGLDGPRPTARRPRAGAGG